MITKIYQRYIIKNLILSFFAIIFVFISLIWFSKIVVFIQYITENGIALTELWKMFLLILPKLLLFGAPISLFTATLMTYQKFSRNNEITILKNSGLSRLKIASPALFIGLLFTIFSFYLSFYLIPFANKELKISKLNLQNNYFKFKVNPKTFEQFKKITIYTKFQDKRNRLYGILIHDQRSANNILTITAETGKIIAEKGVILLEMNNGSIQRFNPTTQKSDILYFQEYILNLTENNADNNNQIKWKPQEQYLLELFNPDRILSDSEQSEYNIEIYQRFLYPLFPFFLVMIALFFILKENFTRHGGLKNIAGATLFAMLFLIINIIITDIMISFDKIINIFLINVGIVIFYIFCDYLYRKFLSNL